MSFTLLREINRQRVPMVYTMRKNANFVCIKWWDANGGLWEASCPNINREKTQELGSRQTKTEDG